MVSGLPACGKSTFARRVAEELVARGVEVVGFCTPEVRSGGRRVGFDLLQLPGGERLSFARKGAGVADVPVHAGYVLELESLARVLDYCRSVVALRDAFLVVDEVGPMEMMLEGFWNAVLALALNARKGALLTAHRKVAERLAGALGASLWWLERDRHDVLLERVLGAVGGRVAWN